MIRNPKFDAAFIEQLRSAMEPAAADARSAGEELDAAIRVLNAIDDNTSAHDTILLTIRRAVTKYDNLSSRAEKLRQLLDSLES